MSMTYQLQGNQAAIDQYTAAHVASGVLLRLIGRVPWWAALGLAIGWEVVEIKIKKMGLLPVNDPDSFGNWTVDILSVMAGYGFGRLLDGGDIDLLF
jgi:hypothetical protein